uniref:ORC-CDC6 family AAA ATPase n=1 Tax=Acetatifactor sp. TaxID=1872090 RepID=UPI004055EBC4
MDTPFSEYKATELTQVRLYDYFVEPRYISKMHSNDVVFIIGQRGTGKTTLLKYLCETYNRGKEGVYTRLGIYYRFDINKMHSFWGSALSEEQWSTLFAHCFSVEICLELTKLLISLKKKLTFSTEKTICRRVSLLFFDEIEPEANTFEELQEHLERIEYQAKKYKRNPLRVEAPIIGECEKAFEEYCMLIAQEEAMRNVCIHFLFDEYENMLDYQKKFINSCAKHASSWHTYKICVRPGGNNQMETLVSAEILREADDFKTLDYISDILGDENDVQVFMRNACKRRLLRYYQEKGTAYTEKDLEIEMYFADSISDDEHFMELERNEKYFLAIQSDVKQEFQKYGYSYAHNWNLMQMKLFLTLCKKRGFDFLSTVRAFEDENKTYRNWLNNYKKSILYQCFSEQGLKFNCSGFSDIINIAGNVVRYVLEICDYCFLCTGSDSNGKYLAISDKLQTEATYRVSQRRFQQISTIPDCGQELKQMVLVIGTIFNMYHRDRQLKRFEPNHFSIDPKKGDDPQVAAQVKKAMAMGVTYGVFEATRSTKNRSNADVPIENEEYHLHPILTPYFQISWRKKQKCRFSLSEVYLFLFGSDDRITKILNEYLGKVTTSQQNNSDEGEQISFIDLKNQSF